MQIQFDDLVSIAKSHGIGVMSSLDRASSEAVLSRSSEHLSHWQASGYSASMSFMNKNSELFASLDRVLPSAKSCVLMAVPYSSPSIKRPQCEAGFGNIARYAWAKDYHFVLRELLNSFVNQVCSTHGFKDLQFRVFSDSVPILERALADAADLGFIGKSSMLIKPGMGTYFFLCEVLWDLEISDTMFSEISKSSCGSCSRCIDKCPTQAIVKDKVIDARRCISYLTIENRSVFSLEEMSMLGDWLFGCDVCQDVCPYNHEGTDSGGLLKDFSKNYIAGPMLNIRDVLEMRSTKKFNEVFKHSPVLRTRRSGLLRNALSVAYNQRLFSLLPQIVECACNDNSELIRTQAYIVLESFLEISDGNDTRLIIQALERINNK